MHLEPFFGGVIGHPIRHSLSPDIYNCLARGLKKPISYRKLDVPPRELAGLLKSSRALGLFKFFNITMPHKEATAKRMNRLSDAAKVLGAVNVVHFHKDGLWEGHNTDVFGILQTWKEKKIQVRSKSVVILGAGGAALAAAYAAASEKAKVVLILNRTLARARSVVKKMKKVFPQTHFSAGVFEPAGFPQGADLYVNATPLGMKGNRSPVYFSEWKKAQKRADNAVWVFDMVYRPMKTDLLKQAETLGFKTVGGLDMLVWQGVEAWQIWFGPLANPEKWKKKIYKELVQTLKSQEKFT